jgi:cytochrome c553
MTPRRTQRTPHSGWTLLVLCAASVSVSVAVSAVGCSEERLPTLAPTAGEGGGATTTSDTVTVNKGQQLFEAFQEEMMDKCGTCHDAGGFADTPFLREPRYESLSKWPNIVRKDPNESVLVTHPIIGQKHNGPSLDSDELKDTLFPKIKEWLAEEAKTIAELPPEQQGKSIDPIAPILGFNAIYLTPLSNDFEGMAVTFNATELTPSTLELSDVQVHTSSTMGVHVVHPLFSVHPKGGDPNPDPADSFSNVDQYVEFSAVEALGPGTLILTNWVLDGKLQLSFETIEKYSTGVPDGGADGGVVGGCINLDAFTTNAQPQLNQCLQCHGGANPQAAAAVDMTGLVNNVDVAGACAQVRNRISPADSEKSQIFITTDPDGTAAHPYKFNQDKNAFNGFKSSVSVWIAAEK